MEYCGRCEMKPGGSCVCVCRAVGGIGVGRAVGLGGCVSTDALWPGVTTRARKLNPTINHQAPPLVIKRALAMIYEPCHNYWLTLARSHTHTVHSELIMCTHVWGWTGTRTHGTVSNLWRLTRIMAVFQEATGADFKDTNINMLQSQHIIILVSNTG